MAVWRVVERAAKWALARVAEMAGWSVDSMAGDKIKV